MVIQPLIEEMLVKQSFIFFPGLGHALYFLFVILTFIFLLRNISEIQISTYERLPIITHSAGITV